MAKKKPTKKKSKPRTKKRNLTITSQQKLVFGSLLLILGILLSIAFLSFFFTGQADQSILTEFTSRDIKAQNWLNKFGAWVSDLFIHRGFGIASFIFSGLIFISGIYILLNIKKARLARHWFWGTLIAIWTSVLFGFLAKSNPLLSGTIGFEMNDFLQDYIGKIGTSLFLLFGLIAYLAVRFKMTAQHFGKAFTFAKKELKGDFKDTEETDYIPVDNSLSDEADEIKSAFEIPLENIEPTITHHSKLKVKKEADILEKELEVEISVEEERVEEQVEMKVETITEEKSETNNLADKLVKDFGSFDPTLELGNYQFPPLNLLKKYDSENITINQEELEENKNKIVNTLNNYKIGISSIKATIGPTVTLYEIVPEAGIRISKIKNGRRYSIISFSAWHSYHSPYSWTWYYWYRGSQ